MRNVSAEPTCVFGPYQFDLRLERVGRARLVDG
jgi:hypothetical protein